LNSAERDVEMLPGTPMSLASDLHAFDDGTLVMPLRRPSVVPASYWHRLI
jgi:hypothetical protein